MRPRPALALLACLATLLTGSGCSLRGDDDVPSATPNPGAVFTIVTPTPGTPPAGELPGSYVVQQGDTLFSIAEQLDIPMADLQRANGIEDPNTIFVGQVLVVPTPRP